MQASERYNLLIVNPELCKEWNYNKNELGPENYCPKSGKKVWWVCKNGHEWETTIASRNNGTGCPYCANQKVCKENCLKTKNPELCKEWDYDKNIELPENFVLYSHKKVWWKCKEGHEWESVISSRSAGVGCPYCAGKKVDEKQSLLAIRPDIAKQWNYNRNDITPKDVSPCSGKRVWWICENGHEWEARVASRNDGGYRCHRCPYCTSQKVCKENCLKTKNPELCKEWNYDKNEFGPENYMPNSNKKVWWVCKNKHKWQAAISDRNHGNGCPYCSGHRVDCKRSLKYMNTDLSDQWNYKKNKDLKPEDFMPSSHKRVWWICKNGHEWEAKIFNRNNGHGCPYCTGQKVCKENCLKTKNPELCNEWNYNKNEFGPENYMPNSNKKVWWVCRNGHEWKAMISDRNRGRGCPKCSNIVSKPCSIWLDSINIIKREQYININGRKFYVDGIKDNIVYEFLGNYWHGNPYIFDPCKINRHIKCSFGELLYKTIDKLNCLYNNGFTIIYKWEADDNIFEYKNITANIESIISVAENVFKNKAPCNVLKLLGDLI